MGSLLGTQVVLVSTGVLLSTMIVLCFTITNTSINQSINQSGVGLTLSAACMTQVLIEFSSHPSYRIREVERSRCFDSFIGTFDTNDTVDILLLSCILSYFQVIFSGVAGASPAIGGELVLYWSRVH